jgi:cell division protein FtsW (lipid II flippase)
MATSVYTINKGINKPIEFRGLKAQYIGYLGVGLLTLLILFAALYISGVNMFICLALILILGTALFMTVYHLSAKYGQYGLLKKAAKRSIPERLTCNSRHVFLSLQNPES